MKPPKRLFRKRPPAPEVRHIDEILTDGGSSSTRLMDLMRRVLTPAAFEELAALDREAMMLVMMIFYARSRGLDRVEIGKEIFNLASPILRPGELCFYGDRLTPGLRAAWEQFDAMGREGGEP